MSCTYKAIRVDPKFTAVKVTSTNGLNIYMPTLDDFEKIRFHIATTSHTGGRLAEAYKAENRLQIMPTDDYLPCVKAIYQMSEYDPSRKMFVDKPVDNWIYNEACKCLEKTIGQGRIDLGDGFVVPNTEESASIKTKVMSEGSSLLAAIQSVCPDIMPPLESITCIENGIINTNWQLYDIYKACRADYIVAQAKIKEVTDGTIPPEKEKSNTIIYVVAALALLLLLSKR